MLRFRFYRPFRPRCQVRGPQHLVVLSSHFHYILHKRFTSIRSRLNGFPTAYPLCFHALPTAFPQRFPHRFPQAFPGVFTTFAQSSPPARPQLVHTFSARHPHRVQTHRRVSAMRCARVVQNCLTRCTRLFRNMSGQGWALDRVASGRDRLLRIRSQSTHVRRLRSSGQSARCQGQFCRGPTLPDLSTTVVSLDLRTENHNTSAP